MTLKVVTMKVMCEECDVEDVKKELKEWFFFKYKYWYGRYKF